MNNNRELFQEVFKAIKSTFRYHDVEKCLILLFDLVSSSDIDSTSCFVVGFKSKTDLFFFEIENSLATEQEHNNATYS